MLRYVPKPKILAVTANSGRQWESLKSELQPYINHLTNKKLCTLLCHRTLCRIFTVFHSTPCSV